MFLGIREDEVKEPESAAPELDLKRLRPYTFQCPQSHIVDGSPGQQVGVAVLGPSGSSKTHMLPGLVRELFDLSTLRPVGVTLSNSLYGNPKLSHDVVEVYRRGRALGPTPPGKLLGPFSYKMQIGRGRRDPDPLRYSLLLYDIAGEDLAGIMKVVEKAPFMLRCRALMVLIDPYEFLPSQFESEPVSDRARVDAARDVRGGIQVIAETLEEAWQVSSARDLDIPICFVLAKADAIDWTGDYDWAAQTSNVISAVRDGGSLRSALVASSDLTRHAFAQLGGELVIDEIEDSFSPEMIRFAAASATSSMPLTFDDAPHWADDPAPNGVGLSLLHLLDVAGLMPQSVAKPDPVSRASGDEATGDD